MQFSTTQKLFKFNIHAILTYEERLSPTLMQFSTTQKT